MVLTGPELHHLRVRRLGVGTPIVLFDGCGNQRQGIVTAVDRRQAWIQFTHEDIAPSESPLRVVLAQAVLKATKLDIVIEKATELGVQELLLFTAERSVSHTTAVRMERWHRIAESAAKQCQRSTVPSIRGPIAFAALLREPSASLRLFFWEAAPHLTLDAVARRHRQCASVLAVVGPEGGFTAREADLAEAAGFQVVGLSRRILRAETAAIVTLALCQFLWGDLGSSHP